MIQKFTIFFQLPRNGWKKRNSAAFLLPQQLKRNKRQNKDKAKDEISQLPEHEYRNEFEDIYFGSPITNAPETKVIIMNIESIVFDFDGTLAELRLDFADMKNRLNLLSKQFHPISPPPPFLPVLEWVGWLEESIGETDAILAKDFRKAALSLIVEIEMEAARNGSLFPFTRPLLIKILQGGISTAIITRNCDSAVRSVFPDISTYCSAFFARDHVPSPKPDPAHLIRALEAIGADSGSALMVGDHPLDIQTGKAAGVLTAGVCSGNTSREVLLESGADWVAENCEELINLLTVEGALGGCFKPGFNA